MNPNFDAGPAGPPGVPARKLDWFSLLLGLLLLAACVEILLLIRQNRELKAALAMHDVPTEQGPDSGTKAEPISGVDPSGKTVLVNYGQDPRSTVLCVFSTTCSACNENLKVWKETVAKADPTKVRVLAVTYEDAKKGEEHLRASGLGLPVLQVEHKFLAKSYKMGVIPLTIVIASDGSVERSYPGVLEGDGLTDLKKRLGV